MLPDGPEQFSKVAAVLAEVPESDARGALGDQAAAAFLSGGLFDADLYIVGEAEGTRLAGGSEPPRFTIVGVRNLPVGQLLHGGPNRFQDAPGVSVVINFCPRGTQTPLYLTPALTHADDYKGITGFPAAGCVADGDDRRRVVI